MISLGSTWSEVVMLLVAGGAGLLGGVGASLLEMKIERTTPTAGQTGAGGGFLSAFTPIFLGGVAAVAIIYFFDPVNEVETAKGEVLRSYELLRLVPLSLIVGTAGVAFLQSMQSRVMSTLNAARAETTKEAGKTEIGAVASAATEAAKTGIKDSPELKQTLVASGVSTTAATAVLDKMADQAAEAVKSELGPRVEAAERTVDAAAALPGSNPVESDF